MIFDLYSVFLSDDFDLFTPAHSTKQTEHCTSTGTS